MDLDELNNSSRSLLKALDGMHDLLSNCFRVKHVALTDGSNLYTRMHVTVSWFLFVLHKMESKPESNRITE